MGREKGTMRQSRVSVVIVSWNTRELLKRCLRSLQPETENNFADVWVVDNGSSDGSQGLVRREFPWTRLIESNENLGFGKAVNCGAAQTQAEWLVAANADIEVPPGALGELTRAAEKYPTAAAIAPRLELASGATQKSFFRFPSTSDEVARSIGMHRLLRRRTSADGGPQADEAIYVDYAMGAFVLLRRAPFDAVGGFDASQWMYGEDMDLSWRLKQEGWRTVYVPSVTIKHVGGAAADQAFPEGADVRKLSALYLWIERRLGKGRLYVIATARIAGAGGRMLMRKIVSLFTGGAEVKAEPATRWLVMNVNALRGRHAAGRRDHGQQ